jgi:regulator of replication initiation timing
MIRALATALLCAAAIVAGDVLFRTSLLRQLRPVILSPADQAVVEPPVQVAWEGPPRMRILLSSAGERQRDLGIGMSPFTVENDQFPRSGGYEVELQAPRFGSWIRATRVFQVQPPETPPQQRGPDGCAPKEARDLLRALDLARNARDRAQNHTKFLRQENAALRDESQRLAQQLESSYRTQEQDAERVADIERRLTQLAEENRSLADENATLRVRLGSVIPCTVWGYYSYPQPQMVPITRRFLIVSDPRGQIFRGQPECELLRRADPTAATICFCAGNSFGG